MGVAPKPRAPRQSITGLYSNDVSALPLMQGPEDMPQPDWGETVMAGLRTTRDDWIGQREEDVTGAYARVVDALSARTGKSVSRYMVMGGGNNPIVLEDGIFRDLADIRRTDPGFLPDVPRDAAGFRQQVAEQQAARRKSDQLTLARDKGWGGTIGSFLGAAADPVNLATLPLGGGGATFARRVVTEALVNAAIEGVEQPIIAQERAQRGESLTLGEAGVNIGMAALLGAGMQGVIVEPLSALARRVLPRERMTDAEQGAVNLIEREDEMAATSPFVGGRGTEVHLERLEQSMRAIDEAMATGAPVAIDRDPLTVPRETSVVPQGQFKAKLATGESGGNDLAVNPNSSAMGRYQFVAPTWLRYYVQRFGRQGLSDEAILAKRTDPALQEQLVDDLIADNTAALRRLGAPATDGNLYLMHFAGQGGAAKILRAAPDTPIEQLLSKKAIKANPFLRGKNAGDVIEWAHAKMGSAAPDAVVLRDLFGDDAAGDAEWAAAQRASEAANAEAAALARERPATQGELDFGARAALDDADAPVRGMDWEPQSVAARDPLRSNIASINEADVVGPKAVLGMVPAKGEPGIAVTEIDGAIALAVFRDQDGTARGVAQIPLTAEARQLYDAATVYVTPEFRRQGIASQLYDALRSKGHPIEVQSGAGDLTPEGAAFATAWRDRLNAQMRAGAADRAGPLLDEKMSALEQQWAAAAAQGVAPNVRAAPSDDKMAVLEHPMEVPHSSAPSEAFANTLDRFDDPNGEGARHQTESLEHDLRMAMMDAPDASFRLEGDAEPRSLSEIFDDLDQEAAALDAARRCMSPPTGE